MSNPMRHLPPLALAAILLCALSCGTDEPRGRDNGTTPVPHDTTHRNDTTPTDTTHHNTTPNDTTGNTNPADTTHHGNNDTTTTFSITLNAPRDYGYMGQTLQLNAVTSAAATVSWHSSNSAVATVDASGLVYFNNRKDAGKMNQFIWSLSGNILAFHYFVYRRDKHFAAVGARDGMHRPISLPILETPSPSPSWTVSPS